MANKNLSNAKNAKNDEFYTQYADIQKEVNAYIDYDADVFLLYSEDSDIQKLYAEAEKLRARGVSVRCGKEIHGNIKCKKIMKLSGEELADG